MDGGSVSKSQVIVEIIGKKGTIIVPAHTFYLANTNKTFDIKNSKFAMNKKRHYDRN